MKKGFTIIELLIVIAVISILVGIALPRFRGMQEEAMIAEAKGELRTLQTAVESYNIHNGSYPTAGGTWQSALTGATPNIVGTALIDPFSGSAQYLIVVSDNGNYYAVYSIGAGGNGAVASVSDAGVVTETNGASCIFVSGSAADTTP